MMVLRWMLVFTQLLPRLVAPQTTEAIPVQGIQAQDDYYDPECYKDVCPPPSSPPPSPPVECNAEIPCANGGFCDAAQCLLCPKDGECAIDTLSDYAIVSCHAACAPPPAPVSKVAPTVIATVVASTVATSVSASVTVSVATTVAANVVASAAGSAAGGAATSVSSGGIIGSSTGMTGSAGAGLQGSVLLLQQARFIALTTMLNTGGSTPLPASFVDFTSSFAWAGLQFPAILADSPVRTGDRSRHQLRQLQPIDDEHATNTSSTASLSVIAYLQNLRATGQQLFLSSLIVQASVTAAVFVLHAILLSVLKRVLPGAVQNGGLAFPQFEIQALLFIYESTCQTAIIALAVSMHGYPATAHHA